MSRRIQVYRLRWSAEMRSDVRYQSLEASLMPAWPQLASLDLQKLSRRRWQRSPTPTRSSTPKKPTNWGWQVPIHAETSRARPTPTVKPRISKGTGRQKRACFMLSGLPFWEHSSLCSTHTLKSQCPRKAHLLWFTVVLLKSSQKDHSFQFISRPGMVRHATRYPPTPTHFKIPKHYRNSKSKDQFWERERPPKLVTRKLEKAWRIERNPCRNSVSTQCLTQLNLDGIHSQVSLIYSGISGPKAKNPAPILCLLEACKLSDTSTKMYKQTRDVGDPILSAHAYIYNIKI